MTKRTPERQIPIFEATPLSYYCKLLPAEQSVTVTLTRDEMAAVLQAYDYGVDNCDSEGKQHLEQVINSLKDKIYP